MRTSAIAAAETRASSPSSIAPSDFFSAQLFNGDAGRYREIAAQIEFSKSRFATMLLSMAVVATDRLFDIVEKTDD